MLDLRRLGVLVSVARSGSLTAAAHDLGVTQPAIGQQLRALESQCGVSLVVRAGRGVRLTAAGSALARRAMPILAAIADVEKELEALQRGVAGTVSVSATPGALTRLVAPALGAVRDRMGGLRVDLAEISMDGEEPPLDPLLRGDRDIAVAPEGLPGLDLPDLRSTAVAELPCVVVVPDGHELAALAAVPWTRIAYSPVLTTMDVAVAMPLQFHRNAMGSVTVLSGDDAVVALVAAGAGIAVLPELQPGAGLTVLPLEDDVRLRYHVAIRRHFDPTPAMAAVLEALTPVTDPAVGVPPPVLLGPARWTKS